MISNRYPALLMTALSLCSGTAIGGSYSLTDLGSFGAGGSFGHDINNAGQVVGFSYTTAQSGYGPTEAFLYANGVLQGLGMPGGANTVAMGINSGGQIVGYSYTYVDGVTSQALIWNGGTSTPLSNFPNGGSSQAFAINDAGQIVGAASLNGVSPDQAALWDGSSVTDLSPLGHGHAASINDSGQAVGQFSGSDAVLWNGTAMTTLVPLNPGTSQAYAINNLGEAVGVSLSGPSYHATLWSGGSTIDLGTLGGILSRAYDINDAGQIVGSSLGASNSPDRATLWSGGQIVDLNTLLEASLLTPYVTLTDARAINEIGQIVANGVDSRTGITQAYLLTPVPIPPAIWLFGSALGVMGVIRRNIRS